MMRQVFQLKLVHLMAFFILVYVGAEVTIGGHSTSTMSPPVSRSHCVHLQVGGL